MTSTATGRYTGTAIVLHWLIALLIILARLGNDRYPRVYANQAALLLLA